MARKKQAHFRVLLDPWVKPYLQQNRKLLVLVILLGVATFASAAALMFTSGFLISKSATMPENILLVYIPIVLVRTFGIARPVLKYLERLASHNLVLKFLSAMRVRLYQGLEKQSLKLKSRFSTGDLLGILADDVEHLQNLYLRTIFPTVFALVIYVMSIMILGYFSIPFALLMLLLLFILIVIFPLVSLLVTRKRHMEMKEARHALYDTLTDAVMGINDWKISGRQADFLASYEKQEMLQDKWEHEMESFRRHRQFWFQIVAVSIVLTMIWFASSVVENGTFTHVCIAAFVLVIFPILDAFMPLPDAISQLPSYENSLSRMNQTIEEEQKSLPKSETSSARMLAEQASLKILFNDVTFSYEAFENKPTIQGLSLQLKQGEKIALLGKSGAGKSTIAKLLLGGLTPKSGEVTINGCNVCDLHADIHHLIAVLQQKPHLFDSTVMNNIRLGNPKASDEAVIEAAKQVNLHKYISSLPDGYHTRMLELGARFSGGERQRIALARILLQNTPIVILDEPTVGLDSITERELLSTIFASLHGKTILWITHHLVGVEQMNRVLFLENGHIQFNGTHEQLLDTSCRYASLYQLDRPLASKNRTRT